jgi:hypothetical protein
VCSSDLISVTRRSRSSFSKGDFQIPSKALAGGFRLAQAGVYA